MNEAILKTLEGAITQSYLSYYAFVALMAIPAVAGAIAVSWLGSQYFQAIARNPEAESILGNKVLIFLAVIDAPVLTCLGLGYIFLSNAPLVQDLEQVKEIIEQAKES